MYCVGVVIYLCVLVFMLVNWFEVEFEVDLCLIFIGKLLSEEVWEVFE